MLRRFVVALREAFGLTGAAQAARQISKLENASVKLSAAVDQIDREIVDTNLEVAEAKEKFYAYIDARDDENEVRYAARDRALRVASRISALVS